MKEKGFTLIELLAVIVILAIIALIATPIILGIINDARKESQERSIELYASAAKNAIAKYQLNNTSAPTSFEQLDIEYDGDVVCTTQELYEDGSIYLADCTVNGTSVEYTYGEQQVTQVYKPQYYSWSSGTVGESLPSDAKTTVGELNPSYPFYLGLDVDSNNKVTAAYACFLRNETEYCLKFNDRVKSEKIIKETFKDVENICSFDDTEYRFCAGNPDILTFAVYANGSIYMTNGGPECYVYSNGNFECADH